ncbi:MAG: DedA family protein [Syntrophomonadaceae bacterium]|jgi:membrane protein DedA with SNARE-associated domain
MEWLESLYHIATTYIDAWGYWGLIVGMTLESACIPIPSEIILPFGGYLVSQGILGFWPAVCAGVLGGATGSTIAFWIGSIGGRPFILKYGRYFLVSQDDLHTADRWFTRYGHHVVFWARLLPVVRTFISLPAGIARMNYGRFLIYTILGSLPWTIIFVYLGVKMGQNWDQVRKVFEEFDLLIIAALIAMIAIYIIMKVRRNRRTPPAA